MKNATIEEVLTTWFYTMLDVFSDLSFRYEYNESRGVYMVSYDASEEIISSRDIGKNDCEHSSITISSMSYIKVSVLFIS